METRMTRATTTATKDMGPIRVTNSTKTTSEATRTINTTASRTGKANKIMDSKMATVNKTNTMDNISSRIDIIKIIVHTITRIMEAVSTIKDLTILPMGRWTKDMEGVVMTSTVRTTEWANGIRTNSLTTEVPLKMDTTGENRVSWMVLEQITQREGKQSRVQNKVLDPKVSSSRSQALTMDLHKTKAPHKTRALHKTNGTRTTTIGKVQTHDSHTADLVVQEDCLAWVAPNKTMHLPE